MSSPLERYLTEIDDRVSRYRENADLQASSRAFFEQIGIGKADYVYNFTWAGVPIIQIPQDLQAMQEIIWRVKPQIILDVGIAWGGTLMFNASMLAMLEACGEIEAGRVVGIDVEIRPHNREAITNHPLSRKITLLEGSSIDPIIIEQAEKLATGNERVLVCLDSNHTHDHVLAELEAYVPLISVGSYCIVGDTIIEDAPISMSSARPWGPGNSPKSAVWEYLRRLDIEGRVDHNGKPIVLEIDRQIEDKIVLTGSPDGYLRRID